DTRRRVPRRALRPRVTARERSARAAALPTLPFLPPLAAVLRARPSGERAAAVAASGIARPRGATCPRATRRARRGRLRRRRAGRALPQRAQLRPRAVP